MNLKEGEKEIQKTVHLVIVLVVTGMAACLSVLTFVWNWELFSLPLFGVLTFVTWWLHVTETAPPRTRTLLYAAFVAFGIFFYGIHRDTFYDVAMLTIFSILLFSITYEKYALNLVFSVYVLYMAYIMILHVTGYRSGDFVLGKVIIQIAAVAFGYWIGLFVLRKHEDERRLHDRIIEELSDVNRRTEDFLTNVSHELRTPINAVTGITSVMLGSEDDPEKQQDLLSIQKAGDRLMGQIGDILDYSEIDTDRLILSEEEYQVSSIINDLVTELRVMEQTSMLDMIFDLDARVPQKLIGDGRRIKKILRHLLDNSMKFTREGGIYVRVESYAKDYGVNLIIKVRDTGIGISGEEMARIIHGFYQSDSSRSRRAGGIGLGLPIVYGFVKAMGGFVQMDSRENEGTLVTISIPQKIADDKPSLVVKDIESLCNVCYLKTEKYEVPEVRDFYDSMIKNLVKGLGLTVHRTGSADSFKAILDTYHVTHVFTAKEEYLENPAMFETMDPEIKVIIISDEPLDLRPGKNYVLVRKPVFSLAVANTMNYGENVDESLALEGRRLVFPGVKTLVVDDEDMNLFVANGIFKSYLMDVTTAISGMEAIRLCEQTDFDIIFLDHMMPEMDGVETLKLLKKEYEERKLPAFVALTANAVSGAREMFLREGFDEFVSKPVENLELERVMRKVLPSHFIRYAIADLNEEAFIMAARDQLAGMTVDPIRLLAAQGINTSEGINYCRGDRAFYVDLLRKFNSTAKKKIEELKEDYEKKDWSDFRIRVHAIKSSARMVGADELSAMAFEQENAARDENEELIEQGFDDLILNYTAVSEMIGEAILPHIEAEEGELSPLDPEVFAEKLSEVISALGTFEGEKAERILSELSRYSYGETPISAILQDAMALIEDFDMTAAAEIIQKIYDDVQKGGR
ncbi:MAG: response regulator [Lachnospiraceae bacterium]|nr:response regulator [Lachnospiraceae bacterium]